MGKKREMGKERCEKLEQIEKERREKITIQFEKELAIEKERHEKEIRTVEGEVYRRILDFITSSSYKGAERFGGGPER